MSRTVGTFELSLRQRSPEQSLAHWRDHELHSALLEGRLKPGVKLPSSRDFARRYGISRGTVVGAFERLQDEGYLISRVGIGTLVNAKVPAGDPQQRKASRVPGYLRQAVAGYAKPKPFVGWVRFNGVRPFTMRDPAISEFPAEPWERIAARRARPWRSEIRPSLQRVQMQLKPLKPTQRRSSERNLGSCDVKFAFSGRRRAGQHASIRRSPRDHSSTSKGCSEATTGVGTIQNLSIM